MYIHVLILLANANTGKQSVEPFQRPFRLIIATVLHKYSFITKTLWYLAECCTLDWNQQQTTTLALTKPAAIVHWKALSCLDHYEKKSQDKSHTVLIVMSRLSLHTSTIRALLATWMLPRQKCTTLPAILDINILHFTQRKCKLAPRTIPFPNKSQWNVSVQITPWRNSTTAKTVLKCQNEQEYKVHPHAWCCF